VLSRLERALQRQQGSQVRTAHVEDDSAADLLNDIDEVTRKLCTALEALEHLNGTIGLLLNDASYSDRSSTRTPMSPSSMTTNSEDGNHMSAASSSWSFSSKRTSLSQRLSINSESFSNHNCKPEEEKQVSNTRVMTGSHLSSADRRKTAPALGSDRWSTQFAYFDPMSVDIDSASSLILGGEPNLQPPSRSPASIETLPVSDASEPSSAATRLSLDRRTRDSDSYVARSASLRGTPVPIRTERDGRLSSSASIRSSPKNSTFPQPTRHILDEATPRILPTPMKAAPNLEAPEYQRVRTSVDLATGLAPGEVRPSESSPNSLSRRTSRIRDRILARSAQAAKSRYRIVNPEKDDLNRTDSAREADSPVSLSSLSSTSSPVETGERAFRGFTPSLYKIESLPTSRDADVQHDENTIAESELDLEIVNAVISSWNSSLWDQAKHNIEVLASLHSERSDNRLARRLQHLLGVIASISGQLDKALGHFLAVFPVPVENAAQLDIGHCATAYWMGDIYALFSRKTEALAAYSVAARNPLFENLEWLPLQQQVLAEKEACRSGGVKTGINISLDHEPDENVGSAYSILDPRIIGRDVARMIMQADIQPSNRECRKLYPHRSRAMALHDFDKQCRSWQDMHKLVIDTTAFDPTGPWPLSFDPFFVLENVRRHRLSTPESDLLRCGLSAAKIPKKNRLGFSCQDLRWLIVTLRACLTRLEIECSEVIIEHGPVFIARYKVAGSGIATSNFFSIPIYRLSFRPGYGVDICSDGIFSSRIQDVEAKSEKEAHLEEVKRVKKLIKEGLEIAAKRQEATESKSMAFPVMSINGVTSLHRK
jgi:hypothetical protein